VRYRGTPSHTRGAAQSLDLPFSCYRHHPTPDAGVSQQPPTPCPRLGGTYTTNPTTNVPPPTEFGSRIGETIPDSVDRLRCKRVDPSRDRHYLFTPTVRNPARECDLAHSSCNRPGRDSRDGARLRIGLARSQGCHQKRLSCRVGGIGMSRATIREQGRLTLGIHPVSRLVFQDPPFKGFDPFMEISLVGQCGLGRFQSWFSHEL